MVEKSYFLSGLIPLKVYKDLTTPEKLKTELLRSAQQYGIENFNFVIYYLHEDPVVLLTDIETEVIKSFPFEDLYNYKSEANSSLGYKHTIEAIEKMKKGI